jgi:hypothetical protein
MPNTNNKFLLFKDANFPGTPCASSFHDQARRCPNVQFAARNGASTAKSVHTQFPTHDVSTEYGGRTNGSDNWVTRKRKTTRQW